MTLAASIVPDHGVLCLYDPEVRDSIPIPQPEDVCVSASAHGLLVLGLPDFDFSIGDVNEVAVEVWAQQRPPDSESLREWWSGSLDVKGDRLEVGSVIGADLYDVAIQPGVHDVLVFVDDADAPRRVCFVLDS